VSCNNDNSTITILAAGGTPNYTYAAVLAGATAPTTYAASNMVVDTNLATIYHGIYVKDANGCVTMTNVTIISDPLRSYGSSRQSMFRIRKYVYHNCNTNRGEFNTVDLRNRRSNRNFQTSPTFSVPGTYTVSIKDKNGYNGSITYVYPLTAAAVVTKTLDCSGSPDAVITTITGGRAPLHIRFKRKRSTSASTASAAQHLLPR
jgi:hypothetical protein